MAEQVDRAEMSGSRLLYLLLGLGLGSLITLLFAPQSGEETRDYVARRARDAKDYARNKVQEVQDRAESLVEQGKGAVREKTHQVGAAVDAGREAYRKESQKRKATGID